MSRRVRHWLIFGVLVFSVSCKPATEEENDEPPVPVEATESIPEALDPTSKPVTSEAPVVPTPLPTTEPDVWLRVGGEAAGVQLGIPPSWNNLSGALDTVAAAHSLGLVVVLASDTPRTGSALLAGKGAGEGAYAAGLVTNLPLVTDEPHAALQLLLQQLPTTPQAMSPIRIMQSRPNREGETSRGAYVDFNGTAVIFPDAQGQEMRTRLLIFPMMADDAQEEMMQAVFVFSASAALWNRFEPTFDQMLSDLVVYDLGQEIVINDGRANVLGSLGVQDRVNGRLQPNVSDIWTFNAEGGQYATVTISPDDPELDLTFRLIDPDGVTIGQFDNAFAGDSEIIFDFVLTNSGRYVIEVSEFFKDPGRYTLSLVLTDEPLFSEGGQIGFGQTIESELPLSSQKVWQFFGDAGQTVSLVLIPEGGFDGILELYAPTGEQLISLDEGFNGDAEVIAGYALPFTGEYRAVVRSFSGQGGAYSLSLDLGGEDTLNFYDAGDLSFGQTAQESLQANEAHAWFFNGRQGDSVTVVVTPLDAELDLDIWLLNPDIERIASQDVFLAGEPERIEQFIPEDGQYLVLVSDFNGAPGQYEITLSANPVATPQANGILELGTAVTDILGANQTNIWFFDGEAQQIVTIALSTESSTADLAFDIVAPNGNRIRTVDEQTNGITEQLAQFTLTENGRWGIVVREFYNDGANYSLLVENVE